MVETAILVTDHLSVYQCMSNHAIYNTLTITVCRLPVERKFHDDKRQKKKRYSEQIMSAPLTYVM